MYVCVFGVHKIIVNWQLSPVLYIYIVELDENRVYDSLYTTLHFFKLSKCVQKKMVDK